MSSVVEICNMALFHIGNSQRIDDLTEASKEAEACSLFYEQARDYVLRADCQWGFATAFAQLAEVSSNPDPVYPYAYAMPTDCMLVRRLVVPGVTDGAVLADAGWPGGCYAVAQSLPIPYRVINGSSQRLITTVIKPATLEYTVKVESSEMFDPMFASALSWYLASLIAAPLARDTSVAQNCYSQYKADVLAAAAAALNEAQGVPHESTFITGRN